MVPMDTGAFVCDFLNVQIIFDPTFILFFIFILHIHMLFYLAASKDNQWA